MKICIERLRKCFGDFVAVRNLSFTIESGEITGFVGPNGSGKTTTMRILATIDQCTSGDINIDGVSIIDYPEEARKKIGYVPDTLPLNDDMSVHEYIDFFARAYGLKNPERKNVIQQLEEFTNLTSIREKMINALSKGMKQRVSIARALVSNPDFILMDEPAAGLDPRARIELRELLKVLRSQGKGVFISSHILSELSEICTSTVIIERGKILKSGKLEDVVEEVTEETGNSRILCIKVIGEIKPLFNYLLQEPMISKPNVVGDSIEASYSGTDEEASLLLGSLIRQNYKVLSFKFKQQNLESVFMNITKGDVQ